MDSLPADIRQELVTSAAVIDRHAVTMHRLRAAVPPEPLVATLRERWRAAGTPFVESRIGPWTVLSTREVDGVRTIQLRAVPSGTEGVASRWQPAREVSAERPVTVAVSDAIGRWLPPGTRVLRHLVPVVPDTPDVTAAVLRERARAEGFGEDERLGLPAGRAAWYRGGAHAGGAALAFRRDRQEMVATVAVHPEGTALVLHWGSAR